MRSLNLVHLRLTPRCMHHKPLSSVVLCEQSRQEALFGFVSNQKNKLHYAPMHMQAQATGTGLREICAGIPSSRSSLLDLRRLSRATRERRIVLAVEPSALTVGMLIGERIRSGTSGCPPAEPVGEGEGTAGGGTGSLDVGCMGMRRPKLRRRGGIGGPPRDCRSAVGASS